MKTLGTRLKRLDLRTARPPAKDVLPFYVSAPWKNLMKRIFAERGRACQDPRCHDPRAPGVRYGDHIVELRDGGAPLDESNVLIRCASCHQFKSQAVARARRAQQQA